MKRVTLSVRVRPELRDWLVLKAGVERRSVGSMLEFVLEEARGIREGLGDVGEARSSPAVIGGIGAALKELAQGEDELGGDGGRFVREMVRDDAAARAVRGGKSVRPDPRKT